MSQLVAIFPTPFASWSRRVALFSVQLVVLGVILHRLLGLPTPVTMGLFATAIAGAAVGILLGLIAFVLIWRQGRSGAWSASAGVLFGLALLAWPAAYLPFLLTRPAINDITTDPSVPPRFLALAKQRPPGANRPEYPGIVTAKLQHEAYPDIRPLIVPRPVTETFEIVADTVRRLRWKIAAEEAPQGRGKPGYIEAADQTLIVGFTDDVVIRIDGDAREARIDVRSASRFGQHDLGRNASRVRRLYQELETQLEQTVAGIDRPRRRRKLPGEAVPKRQKGGPALSAAQLKAQARAQQGSQRGQQPKEKLRSKAENRDRDKQSGQSPR